MVAPEAFPSLASDSPWDPREPPQEYKDFREVA